jgi:hypothetical protein
MDMQNNDLSDDELDKVSAGNALRYVFQGLGAVIYGTGIGALAVSGIAEALNPGKGAQEAADFVFKYPPPK